MLADFSEGNRAELDRSVRVRDRRGTGFHFTGTLGPPA